MLSFAVRFIAACALSFLFSAGCADPAALTPVDGANVEMDPLVIVPGELERGGEQAQLDEEEAVALRALERELEALQITPALIWSDQSAVREEPFVDGVILSVLVRGERVSVIGSTVDEGDYFHVRMRSGATGYIFKDDLILGELEELFAFENSPFFVEPDSTTKPKLWLPMATSVLVVTSQGPWVQVMLSDGQTGWVLASDLADDVAVLDMGGS